MTRRRIAICVFAAALVLGLRLVAFPSPVDRGFKDARLHEAKTEAEVIAILGPPGDYATRKRNFVFHCRFGLPPWPTQGREVTWNDDYCLKVVYFDELGQKTFDAGTMLTSGDDSLWVNFQRRVVSLLKQVKLSD